MKTNMILKSVTLACLLLLAGPVMMAQSREKEEKAAQEAEMKAKKEMLEQQHKEQEEKMRQMEIIYEDQARSAERAARSSARTYVRSSGTNSDGFFIFSGDEQNTQSQLTLRNSFNGGSDESKGDFEVGEGVRHFRVMINGKVKTGVIRIIINYPDGKVFKDMTLDSAAEITFSQSVSINEEEGSKYIGDWKYQVKAEKAEGNYMLQIMSH